MGAQSSEYQQVVHCGFTVVCRRPGFSVTGQSGVVLHAF